MPRLMNHFFPVNDEDMIPPKQSIFRVLRHEGNWKCLMLTLMIVGCMSSIIWCNINHMEQDSIDFNSFPVKRIIRKSPCDVGYIYIPIAFLVLLYLVHLVECYHCTIRIQLSKKVDITAVTRRVHAMTTAVPRVWWRAICYHYVRRKRQVIRYRNGDSYAANQVYYERLNSHCATIYFNQECCGQRDVSRKLVLNPHTPITKIRFSKGFAFANIEAASEFEDQRARFFTEHDEFDDFMEMREGLDLEGTGTFKEYMVAFRDVDQWSWYSSRLFFWIMSCFLLSWPLRIWMEYNTSYIHYTVAKVFGTNYELDPSRQTDLDTHLSDTLPPVTTSNYSWVEDQSIVSNPTTHLHRNLPLSNTSTVDSLELFAAIRENCALVPSYSEAMRIGGPLQVDAEQNAREDGTLNDAETSQLESDVFNYEPRRRPTTLITGTHSNSNLAVSYNAGNESRQQNRRSWTGVFNNPGLNARQMLNEMRTEQRVSYQSINAEPRRSTTGANIRTLIFSKNLSPTCSRDPFGGRQQTSPTDEPPSYEEALRLPAVRNLTRSVTGTEIAGPRCGFLRDAINNRMSCLEGVGVISGSQEVRIRMNEQGEETAV